MPNINRLLKRAATEIKNGCYINLGIGLPSRVLNYVAEDVKPYIHSENGMIGAWKPANREQLQPSLIDAGGNYVTGLPGCSFVDSATSFSLVRKGKLDLCMLGTFEVDQQGSLANWTIPGKYSPGIGGAMELAEKSNLLIVLTTCLDKQGRSKIKQKCTLPLTAHCCVNRIITDLAVIDVLESGLEVIEIASHTNQEEIQQSIEADLSFSNQLGSF